jgi:MoaA/NifB/PqqE/SkfB family radical SAM enzyme
MKSRKIKEIKTIDIDKPDFVKKKLKPIVIQDYIFNKTLWNPIIELSTAMHDEKKYKTIVTNIPADNLHRKADLIDFSDYDKAVKVHNTIKQGYLDKLKEAEKNG